MLSQHRCHFSITILATRPAVPIPPTETQTLVLTVANAVDCAEAGEVADGYTCLWAGLERARELAEDDRFLWAPDLVREWEREVERYCQRYGVSL